MEVRKVLYFLLILLLILLIFIFLYFKNVLNPCFILCSIFIVSIFFFSLKRNEWRVDLTIKTVVLIITSIIVFTFGGMLSQKIFYKKIKYKKIKIKNLILINRFIIAVILSTIIFILFFKETYRLSLIGGNLEGYKAMLYYARHTILSQLGSTSYLLSIGIFYVKGVVYIIIFFLSKKIIAKKYRKKDIIYIIPIIEYIGIIILSTGRTEFIYLLIYIFNIYCILLQQNNNWKLKLNLKILILGVVLLLLFFLLFIIVGYLGGRVQTNRIIDTLSVYTGSSIAALEKYLSCFKFELEYFGEHTLAIVYKILLKLGYNVPQNYGPYEFVSLNTTSTNIYTALRRYIEDYNIIGMYFILFILGIIYNIFFYKACYKKNNNLPLIFYSAFIYPVYEFSIEERFLTGILTTGTIYTIIFIIFNYYYLFKKIKKETNYEKSR